jgi:hypothetical protein
MYPSVPTWVTGKLQEVGPQKMASFFDSVIQSSDNVYTYLNSIFQTMSSNLATRSKKVLFVLCCIYNVQNT